MPSATHKIGFRHFTFGKWREPGELVDASSWPNRGLLEESGYLHPLPEPIDLEEEKPGESAGEPVSTAPARDAGDPAGTARAAAPGAEPTQPGAAASTATDEGDTAAGEAAADPEAPAGAEPAEAPDNPAATTAEDQADGEGPADAEKRARPAVTEAQPKPGVPAPPIARYHNRHKKHRR